MKCSLVQPTMSEFKYACPVCGQHLLCDESQAGSVMDCPTCFQKIIAPQAPASDSKFILTGVKLSDKKPTARGSHPAAVYETKKPFPVALVLVLVFACSAIAAAVAFRGKIFPPQPPAAPGNATTAAGTGNPAAPKPVAKPPLVAPPANDASWSLSLGVNPLPDAPVAGRIHGQDFIIERASFRDGTLTLRYGTRGSVDFGVLVNFSGAQPESLSGQSINVMADAQQAALVQLRWKDADGSAQRAEFPNGYAMRLEFGLLANNHLPGKIYLCTPDPEKSYLLGSFNADARKPKPKNP